MKFLDSTILPALLLHDDQRSEDILDFLAGLQDNAAITVPSTTTLVQAGRKAGVYDSTLHRAIQQFALLSLTEEDYIWAYENEAGQDFSGALQVACARRTGCDAFVTVDHSRADRYSAYMDMRRM